MILIGDLYALRRALPGDPGRGRINVELLDASGKPVGQPRFIIDVATPFLDQQFGSSWHDATPPYLLLLPYPCEGNPLHGSTPMAYLSDEIGFIRVQLRYAERLAYSHPHSVLEVLEPGLRRWLAELDSGLQANAYRITGTGIDSSGALARQAAPVPKWVTEVEPYAAGEQPAFRIRPVPPPPPALATLAQFGLPATEPAWAEQAGHTDLIEVVVNQDLQHNLLTTRRFSADVEDGGFLVGQIYQNSEQPGKFIAHVVDAVPAEQVGASFLHISFTGDSFDRIMKRLATEHQGQRLLGWYHTHLFAANEVMGLSSIDLRLHFSTFRIPWQIAGLLNLDGANRVLRFYVRQGSSMALCHHQPSPALEPLP